jgi:glycosyltransferase involved in cell wall biosynthesis
VIKVVNVITDSNIGGAGRMLLTFLRAHDRTGFDITVILPRDSLLIPEISKIGVKYLEVDGIGERSFNPGAIKTLKAALEEIKPDLAHTHAALSARIAAKALKIPVVHTRHSVFPQSRWKKIFPFKLIIGAVNNGLSDIIMAVSPAAKANMVETGTNPKKVRLVYNGAEPAAPLSESEKARELARLGLSGDDFICAVIARVEKVKGHDYILKAARLFKQYHPRVRFIIAGDGGELENTKRRAEAFGLDNCVFTGFVEDIRNIEGIMDLQLNASFGTEATSLALLEGMSLGVPAVVSDFGGNPYVIADGVNGFVVPARNHAAIYEAVLSIMNDSSLYEQMRVKSLEIFYEKFTAAAMTDGIQAIYRELAGKGGSDGGLD